MSEFSKALLRSPIYWILIICSCLVIFICIKYGAKITGWAGEHWSKKALDALDKNIYYILNDIMISVYGKTSQIDHIVISKYGIFVIETKQYNGYITGSKYDVKWVRKVKDGEYFYQNPIRQNYGHVNAICELLKLDESKVFNIVCIPSAAKINIKDDGETVRNDTIVEKIKSYKEVLIDNPEEIKEIILTNNIVDKDKRKEHVNNAQMNKVELDNRTCPKCKGKLILRKGKYGDFYGCENYPKCKYTRKIKK